MTIFKSILGSKIVKSVFSKEKKIRYKKIKIKSYNGPKKIKKGFTFTDTSTGKKYYTSGNRDFNIFKT